MIKVECDKCGQDCDLNAYVLTVEVIHNPSPHYALDRGALCITDDHTFMKQVYCQGCYAQLELPNIYAVRQQKELTQ